jgi:lipoprotein signal peptidase
MDKAQSEMDEVDAAPPSRVPLIVLWVVFGILTAYPLFEGVSNLIAVPPYYAALGIGAAVPWWLLIIGVAAPVVLYVAALLLGRGRELFARALILAVALAASNALTLSVIAWAPALQPALK